MWTVLECFAQHVVPILYPVYVTLLNNWKLDRVKQKPSLSGKDPKDIQIIRRARIAAGMQV